MNSTFQNDELRNTLKETVSEILNDTGVLNGVTFRIYVSCFAIGLTWIITCIPVPNYFCLAK